MNDLIMDKHILVVEDEVMILMMIEEVLADLGYTAVHSASTVDQALMLIEAHRIDAATLDVGVSVFLCLGHDETFPRCRRRPLSGQRRAARW